MEATSEVEADGETADVNAERASSDAGDTSEGSELSADPASLESSEGSAPYFAQKRCKVPQNRKKYA